MGTRVSPLDSSAIVEIPDELVEAYVAQGWTLEKTADSDAPKKRGRPAKNTGE
jgi:hypothetical protein